MAVLDNVVEFSDNQSLSSKSSGNKNLSTDVLDLGAAGTDGWGTSLVNDLGGGTNLTWYVGVQTTMTGASAAILACLKTHTAVSMKSAGTEIARVTIPTVQASGWRSAMSIPQRTYARYVRVIYEVSGGALTAGTFDSGLILGGIDTQIVADV